MIEEENEQKNNLLIMMQKKKAIREALTSIAIYLGLIFVLAASYQAYRVLVDSKDKRQEVTSTSIIITTTITSTTTTSTTTTTLPVIRETLSLKVPYTVQAPFVNWDIHEESCEEAAVLMVRDYLEEAKYSSSVIDPAVANSAMIAMKDWQVAHYGSEPDLSIEKIGIFAQEYYGYKYEYKENITDYDIKLAISQGYPVIVPVMTHSLYNPHYGAHTVYHVLLVKGYDATGVITNDAGVKEGEGWHYTWNVLFGAIDAQTPFMSQGRVMVVIKK